MDSIAQKFEHDGSPIKIEQSQLPTVENELEIIENEKSKQVYINQFRTISVYQIIPCLVQKTMYYTATIA